jgi:hypothetical protein
MIPVSVAKLSAIVNGGAYSAESVNIRLAVNEIPTATVCVVQKTEAIVKSVMSQEVLDVMRERQVKRLAGVDKTDMTVEVSDGVGGTLKLNGYLVSPMLDLSPTKVADQFTILGGDGILDALDLSIYKAGSKSLRGEGSTTSDGSPQLDPIPAARTGQIPQLINAITKILVGNYDKSRGMEDGASSKLMLDQQHATNIKRPIEAWYAVLEKSKVHYESWDEAFKESPEMAGNMTEGIKQMLTRKAGGFWSTINGLMAAYQMYYIPDTEGSGRFVRADSRVADTTTSKDISVSRLSIADGSRSVIPLGGIVMVAPAAIALRGETQVEIPGTAGVAGQYPDPLRPGYIQREVPPVWLADARGRSIVGSKLDKSRSSTDKPNFRIPAYLIRRSDVSDHKTKSDTTTSKVLNEVCKIIFLDAQLANSSVSVTTPVDLKVKIGERVTVNIGGGGSFTGFVREVSHSIDLRDGKELSSFTQINFTHVRY